MCIRDRCYTVLFPQGVLDYFDLGEAPDFYMSCMYDSCGYCIKSDPESDVFDQCFVEAQATEPYSPSPNPYDPYNYEDYDYASDEPYYGDVSVGKPTSSASASGSSVSSGSSTSSTSSSKKAVAAKDSDFEIIYEDEVEADFPELRSSRSRVVGRLSLRTGRILDPKIRLHDTSLITSYKGLQLDCSNEKECSKEFCGRVANGVFFELDKLLNPAETTTQNLVKFTRHGFDNFQTIFADTAPAATTSTSATASTSSGGADASASTSTSINKTTLANKTQEAIDKISGWFGDKSAGALFVSAVLLAVNFFMFQEGTFIYRDIHPSQEKEDKRNLQLLTKIRENCCDKNALNNFPFILAASPFTSLVSRKQSIHSLSNHAQSLPEFAQYQFCLLYTSPSPRDGLLSRMPSSA
eukprot:TRINITY_DN459_c0_g1_i2.p2 TRINITY_DN459_c0_g1~~TRINITY_DN459_c0_g1_i2.p2  ORF type:complete len:434 (-),score=151.76 TRINITY_DN459_c0_g1_i2:24-1253(-)